MRTLVLSILLLAVAACGRGTARSRKLVQNKGSDTLVNVAQAWAEHYKDVNPGVAVAVSGGGSGVGISALINGKVDIANASRKMKKSEIEQARRNGVEPMMFIVGYDALAVYVHTKNPVKGLTLAQLAENRDAVAARHGDVEQHEVRRDVRFDRGERGVAIRRGAGLEAFVRENAGERAADALLVVDDQDPGHYTPRTGSSTLTSVPMPSLLSRQR